MEKLLKQGDSKFLAGDKMTVADFILFTYAQTYCGNEKIVHQCLNDSFTACIEKHELVHRWFKTMSEENKAFLETRLQCAF